MFATLPKPWSTLYLSVLSNVLIGIIITFILQKRKPMLRENKQMESTNQADLLY